MQVKKYRASSMKDALDQVKRELGNDALIIETRKVRQKGLSGFFKPQQTEVTAVLESPSMQPLVMPKTNSDENTKKELAKLKEMIQALQAETALNSVSEKSQEISRSSLEGPLKQIKHKLIETGMGEESVDSLLRELIYKGVDLQNAGKIKAEIKEILMKYIQCKPVQIDANSSIKNSSKVIFLVGTTGVGKTTTIAKLAAKYHLMENLKVGLITIDTYRIAAVEQLRTYAEIINIPIEVAYNKEEYLKALKRFDTMDLVIVDTAGRSQQNLVQLGELRDFLLLKKPDEVHLVLSASYKLEDCKSVLAAFMPLGVTHLIYSKVDESLKYGSLFDIIKNTNLPISFIANGQRVPEDLEEASTDKLAELILEG